MSEMFGCARFQGDISKWSVANVVDMRMMFFRSLFDGDLSEWDVANVSMMYGLFAQSAFNGDISGWDTSSVTNMSCMFLESLFQGDISKWNVSNVRDMISTFADSRFNGDLSPWALSSLVNYNNVCSRFDDSPLGYIGVLNNRYPLPKAFPSAARFKELRSLCDGLNMDALSAAQYIYREIHSPSRQIVNLETDYDI